MFIDDVEGEIVVESIVKYKHLLDQMNETFPPEGFKLLPLIRSHAIEYPEIAPPEDMTSDLTEAPAGQQGTDPQAE
jgi:hypothetical protein